MSFGETGDLGVPKPFNDGPEAPFYDFQSKLAVNRPPDTPYASGSYTTPVAAYNTIDDYWAWDIGYIHTCAYFQQYVWNPNPSLRTRRATRFIYPSQTQWNRTPHGHNVGVDGWPASFTAYNERPGAIEVLPSLAGNTDEGEGIVPWVSLIFPREFVENSIPDIFQRMWYDHILDGAVSKLMSIQDKPFTNPQLAAYHARRFRNGMAQARDMAMRQFTDTERGWQFPKWA